VKYFQKMPLFAGYFFVLSGRSTHLLGDFDAGLGSRNEFQVRSKGNPSEKTAQDPVFRFGRF